MRFDGVIIMMTDQLAEGAGCGFSSRIFAMFFTPDVTYEKLSWMTSVQDADN